MGWLPAFATSTPSLPGAGAAGVPDGPAAVLIRLLASGEVSTKAIKRASRTPGATA